MRTIFYIAAAIYIAAASCAWAGTFDGLAAAASAKPPTPLFLQPGSIVKTEFKSNVRTDSDADLEADFSSVAQASAKSRNQAQPKPAVAYRERRSNSMAPPPRAKQSDRSSNGRMLAADQEESELDADLEKDLVLTPPPPKTEQSVDRTPKRKPAAEKKAIEKKPAVTEKSPKADNRASSKKEGPFGIRAVRYFAETDSKSPTGCHTQLVVMASGRS